MNADEKFFLDVYGSLKNLEEVVKRIDVDANLMALIRRRSFPTNDFTALDAVRTLGISTDIKSMRPEDMAKMIKAVAVSHGPEDAAGLFRFLSDYCKSRNCSEKARIVEEKLFVKAHVDPDMQRVLEIKISRVSKPAGGLSLARKFPYRYWYCWWYCGWGWFEPLWCVWGRDR